MKPSKAGLGLSQENAHTAHWQEAAGWGLRAEQGLLLFELGQPEKLGAERGLGYISLRLLSKLNHHYPLHMLSFGASFKNIVKGVEIEKGGRARKDCREGKLSACVKGLGTSVHSGEGSPAL